MTAADVENISFIGGILYVLAFVAGMVTHSVITWQ